MTHPVYEFLRQTDKIMDYIPFISFVTNVTDIVGRALITNSLPNESIQKNSYFAHIAEKSYSRSFMLLIPGFGNLIAGIADYNEKKKKEAWMLVINRNKDIYRFVDFLPEKLRKDPEFILDAIQQNAFAFLGADPSLQNNVEFVRHAASRNGLVLRYVHLKNNEDVVLAGIEQNPSAFLYAGPDLKKNREFVRKAVCKNGLVIEHAKEFQDDEEIARLAVAQNHRAHVFISDLIDISDLLDIALLHLVAHKPVNINNSDSLKNNQYHSNWCDPAEEKMPRLKEIP